jgi:hypothetical protein
MVATPARMTPTQARLLKAREAATQAALDSALAELASLRQRVVDRDGSVTDDTPYERQLAVLRREQAVAHQRAVLAETAAERLQVRLDLSEKACDAAQKAAKAANRVVLEERADHLAQLRELRALLEAPRPVETVTLTEDADPRHLRVVARDMRVPAAHPAVVALCEEGTVVARCARLLAREVDVGEAMEVPPPGVLVARRMLRTLLDAVAGATGRSFGGAT